MALHPGRLGRLRRGRLGRLGVGRRRAAVIRTGLAGRDLRCRARRCVRPRGDDLLDSAAAGAGGEQRCDDQYSDDRHAMPPRAVTIQAFQWGQIRTAARSSGAAGRMLGGAAGRPIRARRIRARTRPPGRGQAPSSYIGVNTQGCSCRDANVAADDASSATAESGSTAAWRKSRRAPRHARPRTHRCPARRLCCSATQARIGKNGGAPRGVQRGAHGSGPRGGNVFNRLRVGDELGGDN
jgi:hypothetical protein